MLAGAPGVGKSLLAKNIASILNLPLLQLDIG
ncbi:AAA family ATPase [Nostoc sp. CHAB 5836]|nr:AAA family ATPase [Nostoc sp. CHAB 5836]MCC5616061.1 AAA family ATPase [Nostoc sp. CHAB 5836]